MEQPTNKVAAVSWERWATLGSVTVACCALLTSLWQGYLLQQHNKLSLRPYLEFEANYQKSPDGQVAFDLLLNNNGLGPAEVTDLTILIAGQPVSSTHQIWQTLGVKAPVHCLGAGHVARFYKVADQQMVIRTADDCRLSEVEYQRLISQLQLSVQYQSLYGESYTIQWGTPP